MQEDHRELRLRKYKNKRKVVISKYFKDRNMAVPENSSSEEESGVLNLGAPPQRDNQEVDIPTNGEGDDFSAVSDDGGFDESVRVETRTQGIDIQEFQRMLVRMNKMENETIHLRMQLHDSEKKLQAAINEKSARSNKDPPKEEKPSPTTLDAERDSESESEDDEFISNPYQMKINPSTSKGLKLYQAATKERETLLNPRIKNQKEIMDAFKTDAVNFAWGDLINNVKVDGYRYSILHHLQQLSVDKVRAFTCRYLYNWNERVVPPDDSRVLYDIYPKKDPVDREIFFKRVRINMIGLRIWNGLTQVAQTSLSAHKNKFLWRHSSGWELYDGPTMLQILVEQVNPTHMVGISTLKEKIRAVALPQFNHNVNDMLTHQSNLYQEILQLGKTHDDIIFDTFKSLLTTKNEEFENYVNGLKSQWETQSGEGRELSHDILVSKCTAKYNNLVAQKTWTNGSGKNAKLVALATQVKDLEQKLASRNGGGNNNTQTAQKRISIAEWRLKKTLGDKVDKDGNTWYWCPHQHNDGKGMYVTHKPEDHTKWKEDNKARKEKRRAKSKNGKDKNSLQLDDKLKAALVSKFKCSQEEAANLMESVKSNTPGN